MKAPRLLAVFPVLIALASSPPAAFAEESAADDAPKYEVVLEFEGNDSLAAPDLQRALSALVYDLRRSGVDDSGLDDARYLLERFYGSKGFSAAEIAARFSLQEGNRFTIRFTIQEGPRTFLEELAISGNQHLEESELVPCFQWERESLVGELLGTGRRVYTPEALASGIDCVLGLYRFQGFAFAEVRHRVDESDRQKIRVNVEVEEGPRVLLRQPVAIDGAQSIPEEELRAALGLEGG
ncbi:MAG: hypothetical protein O7J95_03905, partial [Planctomycetota bacterium]|nr:hypothetical protein [Planctomycetota bacterium]